MISYFYHFLTGGKIMSFHLAMFDWNGTLFNDIDVAYKTTIHVFGQIAPHVKIPTLEEYRHEFSALQIMEYYYRHGVERTLTEEKLCELWEAHYEATCGSTCLTDGAVELLTFFEQCNIPTAIISAAPEGTIKHVRRLGIESLVYKMHFCAKNKEMAILEMLDLCHVHARDALYVDGTSDGIEQAKRAGVATFGFTGGYNSPERIWQVKPRHVINSLDYVRTIAYSQNGA